MSYPATNIIRINARISPAGLGNANFASAMLFAPQLELPVGFAPDTYRTYFSLPALSEDFADTTETYKAAQRWLGGTPATRELKVYGVATADATRAATLNKARNMLWWYWTMWTAPILAVKADVLPKNSIAPIIDGGTDDDVAMAIYVKKNPGARLYQAGTPFEVEVTSPKYPTNKKVIRASRPIYVDMITVIHVTNDGTLPPNADQLIKEAVMEYGAGDLIPADVGFKISGFDIGESVPYSTMFTPVNQVIGSYGNSYVTLLQLNGAQANVAIAFNQMSRWTESNITVVIT